MCKYLVTSAGYEAVEAGSCAEAERLCRRRRPHAAILDYQLGDGDAIGLMARLHEIDPAMPVVVLTAHGSIELAVEAMRCGANHFLTKPVGAEALTVILDRCLAEGRQHRRRRADTYQGPHRPDPFDGESPAIRRLEAMARKVSESDGPVLLVGETGSGKGVLARWIHEHGPRAGEPFVELNCAGLKPEFLESELFGYKKGAFTGATESKLGLLEVADRGTLFLDELGDMEPGIQAKLLKVLDEMTFRRLGEVSDQRVDVRLIAATHRDLAAMVRAEKFRADLYFRIHTLRLTIPPLRHRREDVPNLVAHFLAQLGKRAGRPGLGITSRALARLQRHSWPGNIRELRNALERAVLLSDGEILQADALQFDEDLSQGAVAAGAEPSSQDLEPPHVQPEVTAVESAPRNDTREAWQAVRAELRRQIEAAAAAPEARPLGRWIADTLLLEATAATGGGVRQAATLLGIPKSTLARRVGQIEAEGSPPPSSWDPIRPLLARLLRVPHPPGSDLRKLAHRVLLEEVVALRPDVGPALMGVSATTFRKWRRGLSSPPGLPRR